MADSLALPLAITLIFWAYRELSHLLERSDWREDGRYEDRRDPHWRLNA